MADDLDQKINEYLSGEEFEGLNDLVKLGQKAAPTLIKILEKESDPFRRKRAAIALGRMRISKSVAPLTKALEDKDPTVVISAIDALTQMRKKSAASDIAACLKASDASVRKSAAKALGALRAKSCTAELIEVSDKDEFEFVRDAAMDALTQIENR